MTKAGDDTPEERLRLKIEAYHEAALVYTAVKLGLPDAMAAKPVTVEHLAPALGLSAPHLTRFLRGLCTIGLCEERPGGSFVLTPFGQSLTSSSRLAAKIQIVVEQYWMPWAGLFWTLETGKPAFEDAFGMSVAEWRGENVEQGKLFQSYLMSETFDQAGSIIEVLESAATATRVAEVGGSCGALLAALLIAHRHLTGILFERPHNIALAKPFLKVFDQFALTDRVTLVAGDVLTEIPVRADLYLLKGVLQQWGDAETRTILENCRRAMPPSAKLVIIERVLPERASDDPAAVMLDLHMMAITGGQARSLRQFEALLSEAGLAVSKVTPTSSGLTIIEAIFPSP